ncbi:MAG: Uma2 family endonuclease [Candidatus Competibacteraceae bacterium]|nr:Uma2 family endonuclease [Candidatus Competibacteraceae bacterium]MCP5126610.1 Uma2 family endonuclease [Gammaproteobacteria bacterium]
MNWLEVCEHPALQDLPFKIELDETGKIIMAPTKVYHSIYQGEIAYQLRTLSPTGKAFVECAIATRKGTKVADVVWASPERLATIWPEVECSVAPELCVEVLSSTNTGKEMRTKRQLYFEKGALEVWLCNADGHLSFFGPHGLLKKSVLFPDFPAKIEL